MIKWLVLAGVLALVYVVGSLIFETIRRYRRVFSLEHLEEVATLLAQLKERAYAAEESEAPTERSSRGLEMRWQREPGAEYTTHRIRFRFADTHLAISAGTRLAAFAINRLGVADQEIAFKHDHDDGSYAGFRLPTDTETAFAARRLPPLDEESLHALTQAIDPTVDRLAK